MVLLINKQLAYGHLYIINYCQRGGWLVRGFNFMEPTKTNQQPF